jgi:hypothetical protein
VKERERGRENLMLMGRINKIVSKGLWKMWGNEIMV